MLEREAEGVGYPPRLLDGAGTLRLRQVHEPAVMAEVLLHELRMAVESQRADHQPLEVPEQKVSQVERAGLGLGELCEHARGGEELVAVSARQPLDAFLLQQRIELSAGAAVTVGDEDLRVALTVRPDRLAHRGC